MAEISKIRNLVLQYCTGSGIDVGCGDDKVCPSAIGIDSGLDAVYNRHVEFRDLSHVDIRKFVTDLSFIDSNTYDYAVTSHFLEHLPHPASSNMVNELIRVVKPGGHIVIYLPDRRLYLEPNAEHLTMWSYDEFMDKEISRVKDTVEIVRTICPCVDYSFLVILKKL